MVRGSAVKLLIRAAKDAGGGGGVSVFVGAGAGGGGGATGGFLCLHPAADKSSMVANTAAPSVLVSILILLLLALPQGFHLLTRVTDFLKLVYPFRPYGLEVISLCRKLLFLRAVREHGVKLGRS